MRISNWSSDVCSSDLATPVTPRPQPTTPWFCTIHQHATTSTMPNRYSSHSNGSPATRSRSLAGLLDSPLPFSSGLPLTHHIRPASKTKPAGAPPDFHPEPPTRHPHNSTPNTTP